MMKTWIATRRRQSKNPSELGLDEPGLESLANRIRTYAENYEAELIEFRHKMHSEPEIAFTETLATQRVAERLEKAGLHPQLYPDHTGLYCDISGQKSRMVGLRADLDALAVIDVKTASYKSKRPGLCHACGHDVHTTIVLGAGLVLADLAREHLLQNSVRLIFQPAEEAMPGGALKVIEAGTLQPLSAAYALHCDPTVQAGQVGLLSGPITSASDYLELRITSLEDSSHTLEGTLISAWAGITSLIQQAISNQVDPRSRLSIIWGNVQTEPMLDAASAVTSRGTLRCTDEALWESAPKLLGRIISDAAKPYRVQAELIYQRGVPPTVNSHREVQVVSQASTLMLGDSSITLSKQSLAGEDFAWYLREVPGSLTRLGVRSPGKQEVVDLHNGNFDVDETAISVGVELLTMTASIG